MALYLGIDIGTSGCRCCVIDETAAIQAETRTLLPAPERSGNAVEQDPALWWNALAACLEQLKTRVQMAEIAAIALDGTSSSLLLCDANGAPLTPALMYNDARAVAAAEIITRLAPQDSAAHGASSSLAKLLWLTQSRPVEQPARALHQADWLLGRLCGCFDTTDENNALKLGYDPVKRCWPDWLKQLAIPAAVFPKVVPAGQVIGQIDPHWSTRWDLQTGTRIISGTTDSTASFMATGAGAGDAVTALGSTMVLKVLSEKPVFEPKYGIYSHRLEDHWLVGGASNSGGNVLRKFFSQDEIDKLTDSVRPDKPTGLDYYPLAAPGERFPLNDPGLAPCFKPRPDDDVEFFQGLLEGMANIELTGYQRLRELGAPWPRRILTTGGGAANKAWQTIRSERLQLPVTMAPQQQASYGAALLALRST